MKRSPDWTAATAARAARPTRPHARGGGCRAAPAFLAPCSVVALLAACSTTPAAPDGPRTLTVAATADLHGWVEPRQAVVAGPDGASEPLFWGGAALLAGYLHNLRAADSRVVLVDAGDFLQGTLVSNLSEGEVVVKVYNALGYDAVALGNHEFDFGPLGPEPQARTAQDDPLGALKQRAREARFPILGANVEDKATGQRPSFLHATWLMNKGGVKVGIVGVASPGTPGTTNPANVAALRFLPMAPTVQKAAEGLRAEGAEVVIAVAHEGGACADTKDPRDLSSCRPDEEIMKLARALPAGLVDVLVGGHTHQRVAHYVNGIAVIQPAPLGEGLGLAKVTVHPDGRREVFVEGLVQLCARATSEGWCDPKRAAHKPLAPVVFRGKPVAPDPAVTGLIEPALEAVRAKKDEPLGAVLLAPAGRSYKQESALGNLVADVLREILATDLAVVNSGSLRADLAAGPLTYGALYEVLPFDNELAVLELTGAEVRELVRLGTSGAHGALQVSGLLVKADVAREPCAREDRTGDGRLDEADRDALVSVALASGAALDPAHIYTVATSDFLARGGGGLGSLVKSLPKERVKIQAGASMRDAMVGWFRGRGEVAPPPLGRLEIQNVEARCAPGG